MRLTTRDTAARPAQISFSFCFLSSCLWPPRLPDPSFWLPVGCLCYSAALCDIECEVESTYCACIRSTATPPSVPADEPGPSVPTLSIAIYDDETIKRRIKTIAIY